MSTQTINLAKHFKRDSTPPLYSNLESFWIKLYFPPNHENNAKKWWIGNYTYPTPTGISWYATRYNYFPKDVLPENMGSWHVWWYGEKPDYKKFINLKNDETYVEMEHDPSISPDQRGPGAPDELLWLMSLQTDSSAGSGEPTLFMNSMGAMVNGEPVEVKMVQNKDEPAAKPKGYKHIPREFIQPDEDAPTFAIVNQLPSWFYSRPNVTRAKINWYALQFPYPM